MRFEYEEMEEIFKLHPKKMLLECHQTEEIYEASVIQISPNGEFVKLFIRNHYEFFYKWYRISSLDDEYIVLDILEYISESGTDKKNKKNK